MPGTCGPMSLGCERLLHRQSLRARNAVARSAASQVAADGGAAEQEVRAAPKSAGAARHPENLLNTVAPS